MFVGQAIDRSDGRVKVTGRAVYAAEFAVPDALYAVLVQSTIASGKVAAFDTQDAERMPGVVAIITQHNAPSLSENKDAKQAAVHPLLQDKQIVYNGQHVAVAVADGFERATAAAAAVRIHYAEHPKAVTVMDNAALSRAYKPENFRDGEEAADKTRGDPDTNFQTAAVKIDVTYETPVEHHNPMEPHATIAAWRGDHLAVWTATQGISGAQRTLADAFGLPVENVTVICPYVGGGFGSKGNTWPPAIIAAMASRRVGRPVKLVLTRPQMFTSNGYRPKTIQKIKLGADRDGTLVAVRHDGFTQMSDPALGEFSEPVGLVTEMLYACQNVGVTHRLIPVNQGLPTYMRAPGESSGMFAVESAMDELAVALKMDPIELRLKNYAENDEGKDKPFASKGLRTCYKKAAEAFGWSKRNPVPGSMRDGRILIGWGMATSSYPTNSSAAKCRIRLNGDGSVVVQSGTQDIGTGTYTIMAQAAADALGVPLDRVKVELGDSRFPPAPVSGGSQTAASVVPAIGAAVARARGEIAVLAADHPMFASVPPADIKFDNYVLRASGKQMPLQQLLARLRLDHLEYVGTGAKASDAMSFSRHAFGAQFAEVRVDPDFGTIRVSRYVGAFDVGRLLNAKTGRSQLLGGIVFGMGMALSEETVVDRASGRVVNANIAEYLVPVNADVPNIEVIAVEAPDLATGALGAKGIGELPMVGVAPAIANAVYHATGKRVRSLPIRVEDILT